MTSTTLSLTVTLSVVEEWQIKISNLILLTKLHKIEINDIKLCFDCFDICLLLQKFFYCPFLFTYNSGNFL